MFKNLLNQLYKSELDESEIKALKILTFALSIILGLSVVALLYVIFQ